MGITAYSGPLVAFGQLTGTSTNGLTGTTPPSDYNPQRGPDITDLGVCIGDPRAAYQYNPGSAVTAKVFGFFSDRGTIDFAPAAASSNLFVISSNTQPTAGAAITLLTSKAGVTATTIVAPETGTTTGTLLCIDSTAAYLSFGSDATVAVWNPAAGCGRTLIVSPSSNLDGGSFTVSGRDIYGYKITETFAAGSTTIAGKKAFKYVSAATASTTITSTGIGIGTADIFGLPFLVSEAGTLNISISVSTGAGGGLIMTSVAPSSVNLQFGSTVATATSTTPDARGTFTSSIASGSSAFFQIAVRPTLAQLASVTSTNVAGLFGITQFSSV